MFSLRLRCGIGAVRYPPDHIGSIIGNKERAVWRHRNSNHAPINIFTVRIRNKSEEKWHGRTLRQSFMKRLKDDLISATRMTVPGAMFRYKCAVRIRQWELASVIESELQGRDVRA